MPLPEREFRLQLLPGPERESAAVARILQINNYADPVGGAEVYALALTRELAERGHAVTFFGTSPDREENAESLRVVRRPRYDARLLFLDSTVRNALEATVGRTRPELVHVHNVFSLGLDVLEFLATTGIPIVQTVHDFGLLCPNSWCVWGDGTPCPGGVGAKCFLHDCQRNYPYDPEVALHTLLKQRVLAGIVDLALCPSRYLAERMRASGARDVRHLNYFIDPIAAGAAGEREASELVYIGRLEPEKGVEHLLEAMPHVLRADPLAHLTVIGGGTREEALVERARNLGLGGSVAFRSHVPRAELGRVYATATACVLPSIWSENSPLVAYECLAAGLPMIASRIGGIPELVEDGRAGFTFAPRDPRDLAEKAVRLLALPPEERTRMSVAMRATAEGFRIGAHLDRIEELYAEVRSRPRSMAVGSTIDRDLLTVLGEYSGERARLGALFHEHTGYIRHLEQTLADRPPTASAEEQGRLICELEASLAQHRERLEQLESGGPREILRRLARALHISRVLRS
jgi:glycosyltransferase involved in cell wall biosynthesis